jgi:hypothetical protein
LAQTNTSQPVVAAAAEMVELVQLSMELLAAPVVVEHLTTVVVGRRETHTQDLPIRALPALSIVGMELVELALEERTLFPLVVWELRCGVSILPAVVADGQTDLVQQLLVEDLAERESLRAITELLVQMEQVVAVVADPRVEVV